MRLKTTHQDTSVEKHPRSKWRSQHQLFKNVERSEKQQALTNPHEEKVPDHLLHHRQA